MVRSAMQERWPRLPWEPWGSPTSANKRRAPVLWMSFLFEEKAATKEWWPVFTGGPLHNQWTDAQVTHTTGHHASCPCSEAPSLKDTDLRKGLPSGGKDRGKGWSWLYCSRGFLRNDSASFLSTLHGHHSSRWQGKGSPSPTSPSLALSPTRRQTDTQGSRKLPAPGLSIRSRGNSQRAALPFLAPSFQPFSGQDRKDGRKREKAQGVWAFSRAHRSDYWHRKYCTC